MKLIIFDLDQTLVDFIPLHDETMSEIFRRFFGIDARLTETDFAGKNLNLNFAELARLKGVPEELFRKHSHELLEAYERTFAEKVSRNDIARRFLPGAREVLEELSKTDHVVALYTGSSRGVVEQVFRATGLGRYFRFCFYGTEVARRADMVRLAIEKARKSTGRQFESKDVVVIGDSVRDVECGKEFNALTIAVATGFHSEEELAGRRPDHLFKSLEDYKKVLEAIG